MTSQVKTGFALVKQAAKGWSDDKAPRLGAALAYYTIFSISPLVIIVIAIAGFWFNTKVARGQIIDQISGLVGPQGGKAIEAMLVSANKPHQGTIATIIAVVTLLVGATGVFVQLQDALNSIWEVKPKPNQGIRGFITQRVLSFAMIVVIGFLMLVSLILTAGLSALGKYMGGLFPGWVILGHILNFALSFGVVALLFACIFKFLPDVKIRWRDVWFGSFWTAALFVVGKTLLGLYLGRGSMESAYGAAGSLVVVLVWVYYSSQILFFGAELTRFYAKHAHSPVCPKEHAMWMSSSEALGEPTVEDTAIPGKNKATVHSPASPNPQKPQPLKDLKSGVHVFPSLVLLGLVFLPLGKRKLKI